MANNNLEALTTIISVLKDLDPDTQKRTIHAVITFLDIPMTSHEKEVSHNNSVVSSNTSKKEISFSENRTISPKDFFRDKSPRTDVERIACLAYYLTHYRDLPHFKTIDLSSLNTEAAQPKLSNAAYAVDNAAKSGILVQAIKGTKQLSSAGELYVQALPDRDAARDVMKNMRPKRKNKKPLSKNNNE